MTGKFSSDLTISALKILAIKAYLILSRKQK